MNNYILVSIKGDYLNLFLRNCLNNNIYFRKIKYVSSNKIIVEIEKSNYNILKKRFKSYKIKKIKDIGFIYLQKQLKNNIHLIIAFIIGIFLLLFMSKIIIKIDIIHSDYELRRIIKLELEDYGVKRLSFKKSYKELQKIKNKIKEKYKDKIEWIEIINEGMVYSVRIEERIINENPPVVSNCHIVSKKDAFVTDIISSSGERLVDINTYVSKGEILISGDITFNNEIKASICAKGEVYGEVWYDVNLKIPLKKTLKEKTNNKRYNLKINNHKIFRSQYEFYTEEKNKIFDFFGVNFYWVKEYEYKEKEIIMTEEEALNYGLSKIDESFTNKFSLKEKVVSKKVLKKSLNDSTINIEVFVVVKEKISTVLTY